jgi:hypothetical protein
LTGNTLPALRFPAKWPWPLRPAWARARVPILNVARRRLELAGNEWRRYRLSTATSGADSDDYNGRGYGGNRDFSSRDSPWLRFACRMGKRWPGREVHRRCSLGDNGSGKGRLPDHSWSARLPTCGVDRWESLVRGVAGRRDQARTWLAACRAASGRGLARGGADVRDSQSARLDMRGWRSGGREPKLRLAATGG